MSAGGDRLEALARALPGGRPMLPGLKLMSDPEWRVACVYPARGGQEVRVSVARLPAMFYRIECPPLGIDLTSGAGTGVEDLVDEVASMIADGSEAVAGVIAGSDPDMLGPTDEPTR